MGRGKGVNAPRCRRVVEWGGERGSMHHEVGQCRGGEGKEVEGVLTKVK